MERPRLRNLNEIIAHECFPQEPNPLRLTFPEFRRLKSTGFYLPDLEH